MVRDNVRFTLFKVLSDKFFDAAPKQKYNMIQDGQHREVSDYALMNLIPWVITNEIQRQIDTKNGTNRKKYPKVGVFFFFLSSCVTHFSREKKS